MVGALIGLKLRVLSHSLNGSRAVGMIVGGLAGLVLAAATIGLAGTDLVAPAIRTELLQVVLAGWLFGWVLGPVYTGGGDDGVRPEHFTLLPYHPVRMALGLLATAFVGVAPAVGLVAFSSLAVYANGHGPTGLAVAAAAVPLQLILAVVASRLMITVLGMAVRSRTGAVLSALVNASMMVILNQSWVLVWAAARLDLLDSGLPTGFVTVVRWLPSAWGVAAIDAAGRGAWLPAAGALTGLAAVSGAGVLVWSRLLVTQTTTRAVHGTGRPPATVPAGQAPLSIRLRDRLLDRLSDTGPTGVVAVKELRTWSRDLARTHLLYFALLFGPLYTAVPLLVDWTGMLPWAGVIAVVMAAATSANLFGLDGTALWLNLANPGMERAEVRGRQLAWLLRVAPVAVGCTLIGTLAGGATWTWPWVLSLLAATLGGGVGLVALISVYALVPVTEPARRGGNPLDGGNVFGQVMMMLVLVPVTAVPAGLVAYLGSRLDVAAVSWAAVAVGIATGTWAAIWFGRLAHRRLLAAGPELLHAMRGGDTHTAAAASATVKQPATRQSTGTQTLVMLLWIFCWIPLIPQGLMPLWMIADGSGNRLWFVALHLTDPYRIPVAAAFVLLGVAMLYLAISIPTRHGGPHPPK